MKPIISILGSCRQIPVEHFFECTALHEELTYPHNSKEILQAVQFIKSDGHSVAEEHQKFVFRKSLLHRCQPVLNFCLIKELHEKTDLYLVEVSTRRCYEYSVLEQNLEKKLYVHHIAEDPSYGFEHHGKVFYRNQSDEEIEQDILQIKNEIYPKKIVLVTHICTRNYGSRYELVCVLEKIAKKLNIPIINPSILLEKFSEDYLYLNETVLAHYTPQGQQEIGKVYEKVIAEIFTRALELKN